MKGAGERGLPGAVANLAMLMRVGTRMEPNLRGAMQMLKLAADKRSRTAETNFAMGENVKPNVPEAIRLTAAAAQGEPFACYNYGIMLRFGIGIGESPNETAKWLEKAAALGVGQANELLGGREVKYMACSNSASNLFPAFLRRANRITACGNRGLFLAKK